MHGPTLHAVPREVLDAEHLGAGIFVGRPGFRALAALGDGEAVVRTVAVVEGDLGLPLPSESNRLPMWASPSHCVEYCVCSSTTSSETTSVKQRDCRGRGRSRSICSPALLPARRVANRRGGWRLGCSALPPGRSSGSDRLNVRPDAGFGEAFQDLIARPTRFIAPSWSSGAEVAPVRAFRAVRPAGRHTCVPWPDVRPPGAPPPWRP